MLSLFFYGDEGFQGLPPQNGSIRPVLWHRHVHYGFDHEVETIRLIRENCPTLRDFGTYVRTEDLVAFPSHGLPYEESEVDRDNHKGTINTNVPIAIPMAKSNPYEVLDEFVKFKHLRHLFLDAGNYGFFPNRELVHTFVYLQERKHGVPLETLTVKRASLGWVLYDLGRKHVSVKTYISHSDNCTLQVWNTETLRIHKEQVLDCGRWKEELADAGLRIP